MNLTFEILLIASIMAASCALLGVFLVLRGIALMSDAISHAILPGIVLMFLWTRQLNSPFLLVGATCAGLLTVWLTQALINTERLNKDAALGLVFPLFFSIGIILISQYTHGIHLDMDMVLVGELAFAPFNRWHIGTFDCGPVALWSTAATLLINMLFIHIFYKELSLTLVDQTLAHVLGFSPSLMHYFLMTLTSITTVSAFDSVGAIVVVAMIVTPAATAFLLTRQLHHMIKLSIVISIISALLGYTVAHAYDLSLAGCLATMNGILFFIVLVLAPERGLCANFFNNHAHQTELDNAILLAYLAHKHRTNNLYHTTTTVAQLLGWSQQRTEKIVQYACQNGLITTVDNQLVLTAIGQTVAHQWQQKIG